MRWRLKKRVWCVRARIRSIKCVIQITQRYRSDGIPHHALARACCFVFMRMCVLWSARLSRLAEPDGDGGKVRLRVKGFISLIHREFSGLNCGNSIIMSRQAGEGRGTGTNRGRGAVSGTKGCRSSFSVQTVLVLKVIMRWRGRGSRRQKRGVVRQTGKEATRFFHSAGLRDSSRLIVIMYVCVCARKGRGEATGKSKQITEGHKRKQRRTTQQGISLRLPVFGVNNICRHFYFL